MLLGELSEVMMIGKLIRMLVGRSLAKKRGLSGAAGAAAGLLAPVVLKRVGSVAARGAAAAARKRRDRRRPVYIRRIG
jgi:hypothetical protein